MKPQSGKAKGRRLCKEIAASLIKKFKWSDADVHVTSSGSPGEDLKFSPLARDMFPFSVEAKCQEKLNIWSALHQCEGNAGESIPLLVFRRNKSRTYAVIEFDSFLELL